MPRFYLPFLIVLSGCASASQLVSPPEAALPLQAAVPSPYENAPPEKNLRVLPQFILVDDFNAGDKKNRFGGLWQIEEVSEKELSAEFPKEDARLGKRGKSLALNIAFGEGKKGIIKSSLKGLDASAAKGLGFKCRIESEGTAVFDGKLKVSLKDLRGRVQTVDFTAPCVSRAPHPDGWKEALFPRKLFSALDWNLFDEIAFSVSSQNMPRKAKVGIDEIVFFGLDDVGFLSQKDNLLGFPSHPYPPGRAKSLLAKTENEAFLYEIARDTWKYFENAVDRDTSLPVDHLRVGDPGDVGSYTTPTNLAFYFMACVAAKELGIISKKEAEKRIRATFETLRQMKRWKRFHYNFYHTHSLQVTRPYISVVDLGWLAASWMVVRQAFPAEAGELATQFLKESRFDEFYDSSINQLKLGFDEATGKFSPYHYGLISTEARVASFIGIGKGDLPRGHWWSIYRTLPADWDWQSQTPKGKEVNLEGYQVFEGYYQYQDVKFVPSWGGSLFEFLMPALVIKEKELAPKSFGLNNRIATEVHIDYAMNRQGYPVWGISPASTSTGRLWRYGEFGVKILGVKGYRDEGIIAPYAAFLALETLPEQAIDNIRRMLELYPLYGEYGFYDSVNVRNGRVNTQYLALDQGMILISIANYLKNGVIKEFFHHDEIAKKAEPLLKKEEWFK